MVPRSYLFITLLKLSSEVGIIHFLVASSMSFITKESKHFVNDDENGFIFPTCWWRVSLVGVTAALWMGKGYKDVLNPTFLSSLRNSRGLGLDFFSWQCILLPSELPDELWLHFPQPLLTLAPYQTSASARPQQAAPALQRKQLMSALQEASPNSPGPPREYWMWTTFLC